MAKNLAKVNGACNAKIVSEGQDFQTPWVIYNPNSTNFKVLYSVHGSLNGQNEFYGDEFDGCGGGGSGSGSGGDRYVVTATYYAEEQRSIAPCQILYSTDSIDSMKVDGVEEEVVTSYTFSSVGEHTVEFTLNSDSIGNNTFSGCTKMTSFTIGSGITSVGVSALDGCISLTSVTIPDSVTSIGNNAFSGCSNITEVTVNATTPPSLGTDAFEANYTIYVPCDSVDTYKEAENWSDYASYIEGIPPCGGGGSGSGSGGGDGGSDEEEPVEEG